MVKNELIANKLTVLRLRKTDITIPVIIVISLFIALSFIVTGIVINGTTTYNSTDTNITQKSNGTAAFARLNISSTAPYDSLVGYWSFDFDNSTKAYDYSGLNNDGAFNGNAVSNAGNGTYNGGKYEY